MNIAFLRALVRLGIHGKLHNKKIEQFVSWYKNDDTYNWE